jgi:SAM-dependent MidA family methyltransferase
MRKLEELIKSEIRARGRMTFQEFMELALYHPELGYYASGKYRVGKEGDYYTSPSATQAFGEVLAGFIVKAGSIASAEGLRVVEAGGGRGLLAGDILDTIKRESPEIYEDTRYYLIEKSASCLKVAEEALGRHLSKVVFASSASEIESGAIDGVIISNELADALPFHRARFTDGALKEIYVTLHGGAFSEITDDPSTRKLIEYFGDYDITFCEGQEVEINLNAGGWLAEVSNILRKGFVLTIDYGYLAPELFSPERMRGTYKCMYKHSINENPYVHIGEQDITAHVDFSNLIRAGGPLGLSTVKYNTQGQFLIDWGILDIMTSETDMETVPGLLGSRKNIGIKTLFLPGSMGNSFKILLQKKNIDTSADEYLSPESPIKISFGLI